MVCCRENFTLLVLYYIIVYYIILYYIILYYTILYYIILYYIILYNGYRVFPGGKAAGALC
jgi:hypothetical protein